MTQELSEFFQQVFNALRISGIYALVAIGITIIFGLTGIVKFSMGELITIGAFLTFAFWDNDRMSYFLAVPLAAVAIGALSVGLERGLFRFTLSEPINGFMVSLGLILVLQNVVIEFWGTDAQAIQPPFTGIWEIGGVRMPIQSLFVIGVTFALIVVLFTALRYTKQGRALRARKTGRPLP